MKTLGIKEVKKITKSVKGFLNTEEGEKLYSLATNCPKNLSIVEIGAYYGKSTIWLGKGSINGNKAKIFSVDWHRGDFEDGGDYGKLWTFPEFKKNIENAGLNKIIKPIVMKSEKAVKGWRRKINLLFLDGDHRYNAVKKDFTLWEPFVSKGGYIALHDTRAREGPKILFKELMEKSNKFGNIEYVRNMVVFQKLK